MKKLYFCSSFSPITNSDIEFIEHNNCYFSACKEKREIIFTFLKDDVPMDIRKKMILSLFPNAVFSSFEIKEKEDFLSFVKQKEDIVISLEKLKSLGFDPIDFKEKENVFLLADHQKEYSLLSYRGDREEQETRAGSYLSAQKPVLDIIGEEGLYFMKEVKIRVSNHRYLHSLSVAKTAYEIAKNNDLDPFLCYQAGLLHDIGKDYDQKDPAIARILQAEFSSFLPCPDYAIHQFIGTHFAREMFHAPKDVIEGIEFHCTGKKEMTSFMKCIYCADAVEPFREFETKEKREKCLANLEEGFLFLLQKEIEYFQSKHIDYNEYFLAKEKYEYYLK